MAFKLPKTFIGYTNIKFVIKELIKMYSNQPSFFDRKKINEGIAFYAAICMDLCYVYSHRHSLSSSEALFHVGTLLAISGYHLNEIQKEKKINGGNNGNGTNTDNGNDNQPAQ
jgi:hypothetical protein